MLCVHTALGLVSVAYQTHVQVCRINELERTVHQGDHGQCVQPFRQAVRLNYYAPPTHPLQRLQTLTVAPA